MTSAWPELEELARFRAATAKRRAALQRELVEHLGTDWSLSKTPPKLDALLLRHRPTRLPFAAVPGGTFVMGFRESDLEDASEWIDYSPLLDEAVAELTSHARPIHEVRVLPFLCTRKIVDLAFLKEQGGVGTDRAAMRAIAARHGFRLPSEAELEWLLRAGDRHALGLDAGRAMQNGSGYDLRFGVDQLSLALWAEDDWHPSYENAPSDSRPWLAGEDAGVHRGDFATLQGGDELAVAFAAKRRRGVADSMDMYVHWVRRVP